MKRARKRGCWVRRRDAKSADEHSTSTRRENPGNVPGSQFHSKSRQDHRRGQATKRGESRFPRPESLFCETELHIAVPLSQAKLAENAE